MLTTPGRQALMEARMDRYQQCERGGDTSCLLDYLCIKESIMAGFTQCENWNRFSTLSSSQAPHSANQIKTLATLWEKKPPTKTITQWNITSNERKSRRTFFSGSVGKEKGWQAAACAGKPWEVAPSKFAKFSFDSPGALFSISW